MGVAEAAAVVAAAVRIGIELRGALVSFGETPYGFPAQTRAAEIFRKSGTAQSG